MIGGASRLATRNFITAGALGGFVGIVYMYTMQKLKPVRSLPAARAPRAAAARLTPASAQEDFSEFDEAPGADKRDANVAARAQKASSRE